MQMRSSQPPVLPYLFLTELWERFGFYVVQGLLVLYLTKSFGLSDTESYTITGLFSAIVYISPFFGGMIADKWLGFERSILLGGLFLVAGYAFLAIPFMQHKLLYPALSTIIIGNGLFKPNISSLLGTQYSHGDPRRESGFTIFYIGINIGAFLAGISSGYIKDWFGWQVSFGLASVGLLIGIATFLSGLKHIERSSKVVQVKHLFIFVAGAVFAIAIISQLFQLPGVSDWILPGAGVLLLMYLAKLTIQANSADRHRLIILNLLIISSVIFWTLFLQMFFAANLFIDRLVDKNFFGLTLSTTVFYASESIFIILLGPFFAWTWQSLGRNDKNPSPVNKFVLGLLFAGLGFAVLGVGAMYPNDAGLVHPLWVFGAYFLITIGELLISPIGLSAVTLLAPTHLIGMMMGLWFVATGFGGLFAGMLARLASVPETMVSVTEKLSVYHGAFMNYAYLAFVVAILLFVVQWLLRSWIQESVD